MAEHEAYHNTVNLDNRRGWTFEDIGEIISGVSGLSGDPVRLVT